MKIDKVFHVEIPDKNDPTKYHRIPASETRKVADILETSEVFEKQVLKLRKKYKVPQDGYPTEGNKFPMHDVLGDKRIDFDFDCEELTRKLNIPNYWASPLGVFVFHNVFLGTEKKSVRVMYNPDEVWEKGKNEKWFDLVISENITKSEFLEQMEQRWEEIEIYINSLPRTPKNTMIRSSWAKRITELRDKEGKKFREIADILEQEYKNSDSEGIFNEDYVKILYHRWKNKQKTSK